MKTYEEVVEELRLNLRQLSFKYAEELGKYPSQLQEEFNSRSGDEKSSAKKMFTERVAAEIIYFATTKETTNDTRIIHTQRVQASERSS